VLLLVLYKGLHNNIFNYIKTLGLHWAGWFRIEG